MELKYPEGLRFEVKNIPKSKNWKFPKAGSCSEDCEKAGDMEVGEYVTLQHRRNPTVAMAYYLVFNNGLESDHFSEPELEFIMGREFVDYFYNLQNPKPPIGVVPINIYELQRVQELCRALNDYAIYTYEHCTDNFDSMIKWSEELTGRLKFLKETK